VIALLEGLKGGSREGGSERGLKGGSRGGSERGLKGGSRRGSERGLKGGSEVSVDSIVSVVEGFEVSIDLVVLEDSEWDS
jgi:hypothetical protein